MQKAAKNNLILTDSSSYVGLSDSKNKVSRGGSLLLQTLLIGLDQTFHSRQAILKTARRLIKSAEHAYSLRDMQTVAEAGFSLMSLPLEAARRTGLYYQALALKRSGQSDKAGALFESLADKAPLQYRSRALQSLGTIHHENHNLKDALRLYLEAARIASSAHNGDWLTALMAYLNVSAYKSASGDHAGALSHLISLSKLVRVVAPRAPLYYYFYNAELAYEYFKTGYLTEAEAAISVALNSPFAAAYPEWSETRDEIASGRQAETRSTSIFIERACPALSPRSQSGLDQRQPPLSLICLAYNNRAPQVSSQVARRAHRSSFHLTLLHRLHKRLRPRSPPALS
ncbi:MAG TPA: tetratricopeptide repeat protein [Blastocatellia bacterium]|jgi:hypothetical protein